MSAVQLKFIFPKIASNTETCYFCHCGPSHNSCEHEMRSLPVSAQPCYRLLKSLSPFLLLEQNTLDHVIYVQRTFMSQSLEGREAEVRAPVDLMSGEVLFLLEGTLLLCPHMEGNGEGE